MERGHLLPALPLDITVHDLSLFATAMILVIAGSFGSGTSAQSRPLGFERGRLSSAVDQHVRMHCEHVLNYVGVVGNRGLEAQLITLIEIPSGCSNIIHAFHFKEILCWRIRSLEDQETQLPKTLSLSLSLMTDVIMRKTLRDKDSLSLSLPLDEIRGDIRQWFLVGTLGDLLMEKKKKSIKKRRGRREGLLTVSRKRLW